MLDHQILLQRRLEDREVAAVAVGPLGAGRQEHLDEALVAADASDLGRRHVRMLDRHHDRGAQAGLLLQPVLDLPVVGGSREGFGAVRVVDAVDGVRAVEDADLDVPRIEHLGPDLVDLGAGDAAIVRSAAGPRRDRGGQRVRVVGRTLEAGLLDGLAPEVGQVGEEGARAGHVIVDVAVDDRLLAEWGWHRAPLEGTYAEAGPGGQESAPHPCPPSPHSPTGGPSAARDPLVAPFGPPRVRGRGGSIGKWSGGVSSSMRLT